MEIGVRHQFLTRQTHDVCRYAQTRLKQIEFQITDAQAEMPDSGTQMKVTT